MSNLNSYSGAFKNLSALDGKEVPFVDDEAELESHKVTERQQHLLVAYAQFAFTLYGKKNLCAPRFL